MFFNLDATQKFLDPGSVNLFITHPPYYDVNFKEYGDEDQQIGKTDTPEEFEDRLMQIFNHMEHALHEEGSIFFMAPNDWISAAIVGNIQARTKLQLGQIWLWDFSSSHPDVGYPQNVLIYQLFKKGKSYLVKEPNSCYLSVPWLTADVTEKYGDLGYCYDAFPAEIAKYFIERYSKPGDVVGDLLGGTGTVAAASKRLGRIFVYNDISSSQYAVARARLDDISEI